MKKAKKTQEMKVSKSSWLDHESLKLELSWRKQQTKAYEEYFGITHDNYFKRIEYVRSSNK